MLSRSMKLWYLQQPDVRTDSLERPSAGKDWRRRKRTTKRWRSWMIPTHTADISLSKLREIGDGWGKPGILHQSKVTKVGHAELLNHNRVSTTWYWCSGTSAETRYYWRSQTSSWTLVGASAMIRSWNGWNIPQLWVSAVIKVWSPHPPRS